MGSSRYLLIFLSCNYLLTYSKYRFRLSLSVLYDRWKDLVLCNGWLKHNRDAIRRLCNDLYMPRSTDLSRYRMKIGEDLYLDSIAELEQRKGEHC